MNYKIGNNDISKIYVGTQQVDRIYIGTTLVYSKQFILTINVTGLPDTYDVYVDNVLWPNHQKGFDAGTILTNLTPTVDNYDLTPVTVNTVTMDSDKTLSFVATPKSNYVVEKRWSLNLAREFATDATEPSRTWNNLKATDAGIVVAGGAVFNNLKTEDNQNSTLSEIGRAHV